MRTIFRVITASVICLVITAGLANAADLRARLEGVWKMVRPSTDAAGNPCPFVPESFDFRKDGTVIMSNMPPGMTARYRIAPAEDEAKAVAARTGVNWKGKEMLLMMMGPGDDWAGRSMPYRYSIKGDELTLEVKDWSPSRFKRVRSGRR
jgi:hypothetical protein